MSAVDTRRPPPAETEVSGEHRGPPPYALQAVASSVCTVLGELLGSSVTGKLVAGILGAWLGAFLTAPGRRHGRRIVAVALLLLLLDAGRALAAGVRRRPRPPAAATRSSMLPASWTAVAAAAAAGFALGTGVTAAGHAMAGDGVRLTAAHHQQQVSPPQPPQQQQQTQTTPQQTTSTQQQTAPSGKPSGSTRSTDVTIPSVSGLSEASAHNALTRAGLNPTPSSQASSTTPSGDAIGTRPAAGTRVPSDSGVTLLVSSGAAEVVVPDVTGRSVDAATAILQSAGLKWSLIQGYCGEGTGGGPCTVYAQKPPGGAKVPRGSSITLDENAPSDG